MDIFRYLSHTLTVSAIATAIALPDNAHAASSHTPRFDWKILGGSVNTEQWIYDGDTPIASFEQRIIEQPAEQLMFFNMVPKPPLLRHLKLTPDGNSMIEAVQLYCKCGPIVTDNLIDLDIEGRNTDRLTVTFTCKDKTGIAESRHTVTVTYDNKQGSYIYDVKVNLTFNYPEFFNGQQNSVEFADPWFTGCPGPSQKFDSMWPRRYQYFMYESGDGTLRKIPINHYISSYKSGIRLKPDGLFFVASEPDGNPAIQLVGDTALKSSISICYWGYDIHIGREIDTDELFKKISMHYRLINTPDVTVKNMLANSSLPKLRQEELKDGEEFPIYERISGFEKGLRLDETYPGDVDPYFWKFQGTGAKWDKSSGMNGSSCLKIHKKEDGLTRWFTFEGDGEGNFSQPWMPCKGYKISCYVKTEAVTGRGSTLAAHYHVPNSPQIYPFYNAQRVTGTNDWSRLELLVPAPEGPEEIGSLRILLQQDGAGTTWFDNIDVTILQ